MPTKKNVPKTRRVEFRIMGQPNTVRRDCDGCTACCTITEIAELDSPAYVPCRHLTERGCGIYGTRPTVCRTFFCEWARGFAPEWMKPDKCGVMPGHTPDHKAMQLREVWSGASNDPRIRQFIRESNARGIHVVVGIHPDTPTEDGTPPRNHVYLADGTVHEFDGTEFTGTVAVLKL